MMGEEREKFIDMLTGEEIDAPPYIAAMIARRRAEAVSPTPAAPAGSGWLTVPPHEAPYQVDDAEAWYHEAVAQRAAREAAERERDEALERERRWQAGFEERLTAAESVIPGARAALAASTEREAGLRARLAAWIEEQKAAAPLSHDSAAYALLLLLEGELASLAAPEGGTE